MGVLLFLLCAILMCMICLGKTAVRFIKRFRSLPGGAAAAVVASFLLLGIAEWLLLALVADVDVIGNALLF